MEIIDRVSTYPGRVKLTPVGGGEPVLYDMEWADEPVVEGTPLNKATLEAIVPTGVIATWSGSADTIPYGWHICDGTDGTPDLRDRFIVGAGNTYTVGAFGGEATHKLIISEMPRHTHGLLHSTEFDGSWSDYSSVGGNEQRKEFENGFVEYVGEGQPHNNLPPYYALCYIMKVGVA